MAATPKNHTLVFNTDPQGNGISKMVSFYDTDVANAFGGIDLSQKAGTASLNFITFGRPIYLLDVLVTTGTADTTVLQPFINGVPSGDIVDKVPFVSTNPRNGPGKMCIPIPAGARFQLKELA
jgi:hypothetical protein